MASIVKIGLVNQAQLWGKEADLERVIKETGFKDTPFLSLIPSAAPLNTAVAAGGHKWFYDDVPDGNSSNAHMEGGAPAPAEFFESGEMANHYQIVKNTYGVTGSAEDAKRVDGKLILTDQFIKTKQKHTKSIEEILLSSQAPRQRNQCLHAVGLSGGLKSFVTANNNFSMGNAPLSWNYVRELLKIGWSNGGTYEYIMMNATQKDALDDILFTKTYVNSFGVKTLEGNVTHIGQTPYGSNVKVILTPYLDQDEIIAFRPRDIYKVNLRPMKTYTLARVKDAEERELISEFTLRVCTPFAFSRFYDLKV